MENKPKILVTRRWPEAVEAQLARDFDVSFNQPDTPLSTADFCDALKSFDAVLPTVTDNLGPASMEVRKPKTKLLANYGVGFSHIDLGRAKEHGITITNTPDVLSACTADLTLTLMLMVARRAGEGERELRNGNWSGWRPTHLVGKKVTGQTLGIIGFGRIGQEVAHRAHFGFGMKIVVYGRSKIPEETLRTYNATQAKSLPDLLIASDFVSLHCPGGAGNKYLIGAQELGQMKPDAVLINTARGEVVDENALVHALTHETIGGAGLDVFEGEPRVSPALMNCDSLVMLPHLGSATKETREAMGFRVIDNLNDFFSGQTPRDMVA